MEPGAASGERVQVQRIYVESVGSDGTQTVPAIQVDDQPAESPFSDEFQFEVGGREGRQPSILKAERQPQRQGGKLAFATGTGEHVDGANSEFSMTLTPTRVGQPQSVPLSDGKRRELRSAKEMKILRWGTQRHKTGRPVGRARTLRWGKKNYDNLPEDRGSGGSDTDAGVAGKSRAAEKRAVYFNMPLPPELTGENGRPVVNYPRNKIRTTKYTPLSFLPKNLAYQFKNAANIYFLLLVCLSFVSIFGVTNPALAAIPLIAIVVITGLKDAFEDSRRTILDLEVNNMRSHILHGVENNNVSADNVSLWRKFKKLNTRLLIATVRFFRESFTEAGRRRRAQRAREESQMAASRLGSDPRMSLDSMGSYRPSLDFDNIGQLVSSDQVSVLNRNLPPVPDCRFGKSHWKDIRVGDIVRIHNNDEIPADIILLSTSDADGACYVETKNLDGETNLKVRQSLKCSHRIRNSKDISRCKFWVESEGPHANLYSYQGNFKWVDSETGVMHNEPVNINNMLLRGCSLRNTKWAMGIVMFTGTDTKIMLNAGVTPTKRSRISRELNYSVILNFVFLFVLCLAAGLVNGIYYRRDATSRTFFEFGTVAGTPFANGILAFFVALILYQSLVPISLYISIEIIKTAQAAFIYGDVLLYNPKLDYPCTPRTWNISDDLGQIEYIFSDKTGTLTQNVMEFKKCTINGVSYGRAYTEALAGLRKRQGVDIEEEGARERAEIEEDKKQMVELLLKLGKNSQLDPHTVTFVSKELVQDLGGANSQEQKEAVEHFMLSLALCHSVVVEENKNNPEKLDIKAQSPDEAALVETARDMGFSFVGRTKNGVIIEIQGVQKEFRILNVLEFNSTRKRMSCIVKIPAADENSKPKALLLCKGADSVIYSRLDRSRNDPKLLERTALHLEQFATEGLRTLCVAQREIDWDEYLNWNERRELAAASLDNREEALERVADAIERQLVLLGGTAIEDRLQDGVPDSISILADAGIKLWVLTGDKVETAINIGFSCNLLGSDMELLVIKSSGEDVEHLGEKDSDVVLALIDKYLETHFNMKGSPEELAAARKDHTPPQSAFGVVIDGDALKLALHGEDIRRKFLLLCKNCKAVLCCRVSPSQKAAVVKLVKESLDVVTLAIGDGSNDVAMIQAADVGIGIAGEEGRQAVMSADYAIGQFRYLTRLVLVHGRWSYKRLAEMIPQFFYKNITFTLALFWFGICSNYDGSYLFEYTYLMFYNLAFTSLPVIFLGIMDQDASDVLSVVVPQLYKVGILRTEWTQNKFWWYCFDGVYQSIICFFFPYLCYYRTGLITKNAYGLDHRYTFGVFVTSIAVVSCNLYVLIHQYRWDWFTTLFIFLSCGILFFWTGVWSSATYSGEFYKTAVRLYAQPVFWAVLFVGVIFCLLPRFTWDAVQKLFFPRDIDIVRECWWRGDFDMYPEDYDPTDPNRPRINVSHTGVDRASDDERSRTGSDLGVTRTTVISEDIPMGLIDKTAPHSRADPTTPLGSEDSARYSLEVTRREMLQTHQLDSRYSVERARTSLDLPGVTRARTLISNH
ncbi:AGR120Cp [Eremothecium gossypii ATCC 10895]|uniref:Phospholipid-transporting ATPase n=1 Tax=Eremothecium gossypii (strain ATCC 10895 / CBS 109.51 / FGSC 9923 / NRRL Y-1056) TaxID=284811 RepID=Q74ZS8_EREGS|nr:AGR120Cp [Eremothecium gossypii ATCC 10895]AAS54610.2 AGR120Cp [Eremothecium gossypii ATCC 10895]AEY98940.1 FAGR120Cp [Eremothecium gossypii FDAG1]